MEERLVQEKCEIQMDTVWEGQQDSKTQELHKRKQQILVSKRVTLKGQLGVKGRCSCQEEWSNEIKVSDMKANCDPDVI